MIRCAINDRLATQIAEHGRDGIGADEKPADHRRGPDRQIDGFAQALKGHGAMGQG